MEKIPFKDLPDTSTPYNAATFNTMQNNIEEAINSIGSSGTLLWTNPSPENSFAAQDLDILNFDQYDIFEIITTECQIFKFYGNVLGMQNTYMSYTSSNFYVYSRELTIGPGSLLVNDCNYYELTHNRNSIDNDILVPMYVIGYKTNLFN